MPKNVNFISVDRRLPTPWSGPRLAPKHPKILVEVQRLNGKVLISKYAGYHMEAYAFDDEPDPGDPYIHAGYKVIGWKPVPRKEWQEALAEHKAAGEAYRRQFPGGR